MIAVHMGGEDPSNRCELDTGLHLSVENEGSSLLSIFTRKETLSHWQQGSLEAQLLGMKGFYWIAYENTRTSFEASLAGYLPPMPKVPGRYEL